MAKKRSGSSKGNPFERSFCKQLSLWYSGEAKDDSLFWRTSQSGGRATQRAKKDKTTRGHYGDVCATTQEGQPLTDLLIIELKKGYSEDTLHDILDSHQSKPQYVEWIDKAEYTRRQAQVPHWMIVAERDRRKAITLIPKNLFDSLNCSGAFRDYPSPCFTMIVKYNNCYPARVVMAMTLENFFAQVKREHVLKYHKHVNQASNQKLPEPQVSGSDFGQDNNHCRPERPGQNGHPETAQVDSVQ